jgi:hypothetical protein
MKRLSKEEEAQFAEYSKRAEELRQEIEGLCAEVTEFTIEVQATAVEHFDGRSEKWQESDKGQKYNDWIQALECNEDDIDGLVEWLENLPANPEEA